MHRKQQWLVLRQHASIYLEWLRRTHGNLQIPEKEQVAHWVSLVINPALQLKRKCPGCLKRSFHRRKTQHFISLASSFKTQKQRMLRAESSFIKSENDTREMDHEYI
jgi:hypothetical protein